MRATLQSLAIESVRFVSNVRVSVQDDLDELVDSVRMFGVMQPITVRRDGTGYRVLYGHRRLAAARRAGLTTIPALVETFTDDEITARQIVENLQRKDLSLTEQAKAVRLLYDEHGVASMVAEMVGKRPSWVSKMLTLTHQGKTGAARRLIERDQLQDLDAAYTLCKIEDKDETRAAGIVAMFEAGQPVSRAKLREILDGLAEPKAEDDDEEGGGEDAPKNPIGPEPKAIALALTKTEAGMLHAALEQAIAAPDLASVRISLLTRLNGLR